MSASKGKEFFDQKGELFIKGAATLGIPKNEAQEIWDEIVSFGAWGMNKSHTVSYSIISYWCAYMKRYHALEYAAACLRNAKDDEQTVEILRELSEEGVEYIPFDIDKSEAEWTVKDGVLFGGFKNLHGIGPAKSAYYVDKREREGLTDVDRKKISKHAVKHLDLRPAHTLWGDIYENPGKYNIHGKVRELGDLEIDRENVVFIGHLIDMKRRDQNEAVLVNKRGGRRYSGQTLFLDLFLVDDSVSKPVRCRIPAKLWRSVGERIADNAVNKKDWFLVRGTWLAKFRMVSIEKIKSLTNEALK
jgi:hypothetical protein